MTSPAPVELENSTDDMSHAACWCTDSTAYCGHVGPVHEELKYADEIDCVVCVDLMDYPCRLCGLYADQAYHVYGEGV